MAKNRSSSKSSAGKKKEAEKVHGIENLGLAVVARAQDGLFNPVVASSRPSILSNPMTSIDELARYSPFWAGIATRVLCTTIGWYAVNSVLWDFRKRNAAPKVTSDIDWLNDSLNEQKEKIENQKNAEEQGHTTLAFVDGSQFIGAYKYLFMLVSADTTNKNMEDPSPAVLYARMQQARDEQQMLAAYETFENERFKNSPNFPYIKAKAEQRKRMNEERMRIRAKQEIDHIHSELAGVPATDFDDNIWNKLPLWAQFKIVRSLHNQVMSAVVSEDEKPIEERIHKADIMKIGEDVLLELQAADREPEVRLAFQQEILKPQHALL